MRSHGHIHKRAKTMRGSLTRSEMLLWARLRGREPGKPSFRRQHPIGRFIADFYCTAARLVVEVDGGIHTEEANIARDHHRDERLHELSYRVLRITAREVLDDPDAAAAKVRSAACAPSVALRATPPPFHG
ncbi:MAG TPA: endonuclease domain-containing protein [Caulobacteraceae bacterium]|jgi:very-short-patch-repair endonuclease|nr:endonuclease domain-containing protein [Caulobacteraceae bacterium]